jgi:LemA protein
MFNDNFYIYVVIIIVLVIALTIFSIVGIYNKIVSNKKKVEYNWSLIDVELKRKSQMIPNLVALLKSQMNYEQSTLTKLTGIRENLNGSNIITQIEGNNAFNQVISVIKESYPTIESNASFAKLFDEIKESEKQIAYQRHFYNEMVMVYNRYIESFPNNIIAKIFKFDSIKYVKFDEELDR